MIVSREINCDLLKYIELLTKWNKSINLISSFSQDDIYYRHIIDCLQISLYLNYSDIIVDLGSGAGLPGVVLSIMGVKQVYLIESDHRKCAFLKTAGKISKNEIFIINDRVENFSIDNSVVVTARGFAVISKIFELTFYKIKKAKYILLKGESIFEEIQEAEERWSFEYILHDSITSSSGKIIEITDLKKI